MQSEGQYIEMSEDGMYFEQRPYERCESGSLM